MAGDGAAMIKGFHHVGVSVADIDRSIRFYRDVLEMEQACPVFPFGGPLYDQIMALPEAKGRMCVMAKGSLQLELFEFAQPRPAPKDPDYSVADCGLTHFGVEVADIEGAYARMVAAGVRFHAPVLQFQGGMKALYARDPDGNVFELVEKCAVPT
jgi:catechol 2,3-dioxygenase-like lactoylglutathione lyase family enzyme